MKNFGWKNKTRGGYPVMVFTNKGRSEYPILGEYYCAGSWVNTSWSPDGIRVNENKSGADLIPRKQSKAKKYRKALKKVRKMLLIDTRAQIVIDEIESVLEEDK